MKKYGTARQATDDNIIRRMRFACWIPKATDTHSEYVMLIAFPRQQWLRERASVLRHSAFLSCDRLFFLFFVLLDINSRLSMLAMLAISVSQETHPRIYLCTSHTHLVSYFINYRHQTGR
jgi:hypothetical protein